MIKIKGYSDLVKTDNLVIQSTDDRSYKNSLNRLTNIEQSGNNLDRLSKLENELKTIKQLLLKLVGNK